MYVSVSIKITVNITVLLSVTLRANETGFKGFLLQARDERGPVGAFTVMGNNTQLLTCGTEVRFY